MTPLGAFLRKEGREIFRTWRIWVLPGIVLFAALTSPIIALVTPAMLASLAQSQPGVVIQLPDPTALDAYRQFLKNLDQIGIIALIIATAGIVSAERRSGTAVLVLTKPLSRSGFIGAKIVVQQLLMVAITAVGAVVCTLLTMLLFPGGILPGLFLAAGLWLVFALMMISAMTFFSVLLPTQGAAGAGLGFLVVMLIAGIWPPVARYSFVGLASAGQRVLSNAPAEWLWPILTAALATAGFSALAVWRFERAEL